MDGWRTELMRLRSWWSGLAGAPRGPRLVLGLTLVLSVVARSYRLEQPRTRTPLIFDETYYVNAARIILGLPVPAGEPYSGDLHGLDPNREHPPLGKLAVAAGIRLFGDNAVGWRLFSVLAGTLALLLIYWLVRAAGGGTWLGVGATAMAAADNLFLVHGRIGTLDVYVVVPMLAAVALYLRGRALLAGVALGIACCVKLYALDALLVIGLFEVIQLLTLRRRDERFRIGDAARRAARLALCTATAAASGLLLLWVLDRAVTDYSSPFRHLAYMIDYANGQRSPGGPTGNASYPWQWWYDVEVISYNGSGGVWFLGMINPVVLALFPFGLGVALWRTVRTGETIAALTVAWVAGTFVPFLALSVFAQRTSYISYMVVVLPGVYLADARLFSRDIVPARLRRSRRWSVVRALSMATAAIALGVLFAVLYPIRAWP